MKKLIIGIAIAIACITANLGCKSVPINDKMYMTSYAIGASTGLVADMTKVDDWSRNKVIEIVNIVDAYVPQTNETFTQAWTPIADTLIAEWKKAGEIDADQIILISGAFKLVCEGIDYVFIVRYPKARQYQELVEAATHGFSAGFLTTFKSANQTFSASPFANDNSSVEIDQAAYKYLANKYLK